MRPSLLRLASSVLLSLPLWGALTACGGDEPHTDPQVTSCDPGAEIYCRCPNLDEGYQTCNEQGTGYGPCGPCWDDYDNGDDDDWVPDPNDDEPSSQCDNGTLEPGEACDDGNSVDGDGCHQCEVSGNPPGSNLCPGLTVNLWPGHSAVIRGETANASSEHAGFACADGTTGDGAAERQYRLLAHGGGTLEIEVEQAAFIPALFLRTVCAELDSQSHCSTNNRLSLNVTKGEEHTLIVDGARDNAHGAFVIRATLSATP